LNRLGCSGCPLNHAAVQTPKMQPTLAKQTLIYFLAEAPGRDEDENTGKPLTGPSGSLLRSCIPATLLAHCSFDNVVRDRPPKNRTPTWQEVECCRNNIIKSIEQAKPQLIVGLGVVPLSWMLNSADMMGMRGRIFAVRVGNHSCWFLPTYHPSFILRTAYDKANPLRSRLGHCFRMDISRACEFDAATRPTTDAPAEIRNGVTTFDGSSPDHYTSLLLALNKAVQAPVKAIDIETEGLRPYANTALILSVGISHDTTNFAFALDHPQAGWSKQQLAHLLVTLKRLLTDATIKVAHNATFDIEWLIWRLGRDVVDHASWECTQMQAHFLDERRGKSHGGDDQHRAAYQALDFLVKQHFGISYKATFKLDKKHMLRSNLAEVLIYNAVDTKYTLRLWHRQRQLLKQQHLLKVYLDALPRQATCALMQYLGVATNQREVQRNKAYLGAQIDNIDLEINRLKVVRSYIKVNRAFNPASDRDVLSIFKDHLKRSEVAIVEEKGTRYSCDKSVLDRIDHPLAQLILARRNNAKLKSTYVDALELGVGSCVHPDGNVHCNFNTTFAETGRLSSDEPNMQNFPQRRDAWVRAQIVPSKGNLLVAFDYGQLEACTAAMCTRDNALVRALWQDYDIHMDWARRTADKYPAAIGGASAGMNDPKVADAFRSRIKNKLVFPAIFGAANASIAGYLGIPEHIIDDLMDEFWQEFNGIKAWQDKEMTKYYEAGWVASPVGRRHRYPLNRNQAINHPIQCLACEIVCDAMCRLSYMAVSSGNWHIHPRLNVHDDLTFVVPDNDQILEETITTVYRTMLTPSYACVNVPLSVKCSVGKNWYEMETVGKFWSHRDVK